MNKPAKIEAVGQAPLPYQAEVRRQHLIADNARAFWIERQSLVNRYAGTKDAIDAAWLNLSAADFLVRYS